MHPDPWGQHSLAWSPDDRWVAYVNSNVCWPYFDNTGGSSIWLVATASGERVRVTDQDHLNVSVAGLPGESGCSGGRGEG